MAKNIRSLFKYFGIAVVALSLWGAFRHCSRPTSNAKDQAVNSTAGTILLLVDQSGSMSAYDTRFAARTYLVTFVNSFERAHRIILAGFDEAVEVFSDRIVGHETSSDSLLSELDAVPFGYVTDLEKPFQHILERTDLNEIQLVLMITDGLPEIWDPKLQHLSATVKTDTRYDELNFRNRALQQSGLSPNERFQQLGTLYQKRNLDLIEARVNQLKSRLGPKLMIWDISGNSEYLRRWAEIAGARYMPIAVDSDKPEFLTALSSAVQLLQKKTGVIINEPVSKIDDAQMKAVVKEVLNKTPAPPPIRRLPPQLSAPKNIEPNAPPQPSHARRLLPLAVIAVLFLGWTTFRLIRSRKIKTEEPLPEGFMATAPKVARPRSKLPEASGVLRDLFGWIDKRIKQVRSDARGRLTQLTNRRVQRAGGKA